MIQIFLALTLIVTSVLALHKYLERDPKPALLPLCITAASFAIVCGIVFGVILP